ncbi:sulfotransferase family protein [Phenylobacterium sp.]|uniref:sulfotransferase family protein n=1 Tax=Phenylobacterium sp. TaxID=1871053 RepID=UPI0012229448|nr:sulfotransferase family protein [Phenylobacterium sp.]THD64387.1 MAG: sulfotransferase family protein [Phenylobacterium sp.]
MTLKVIGAGFGRTGTMSLKLALEALGLGPCYHMIEVFKNPAAPDWWYEAALDPARADWAKIFAGYSATVDWPSATFYRELAAAYPEAKVILTERDPDDWFESTQATIFKNDIPADVEAPFLRMLRKVIYELFDVRMHDRDHVISVYLAHNRTVRETIPADRLLVYRVSDGWAPLCGFLGVAVPDTSMPKVNSREEFAAMVAAGGPPHMRAGEPA